MAEKCEKCGFYHIKDLLTDKLDKLVGDKGNDSIQNTLN